MKMSKSESRRYTLDELSAISGITPRNIRYYMQKGLVDRHLGSGRDAYYTHKHLEQLRQTRKWKSAGLSLERIQEIIRGVVTGQAKPLPPLRPADEEASEVWHRFSVAKGVEINIHPVRSGLGRNQARSLALKVRQHCRDILAGQR
jgi:DNA-binding transcriptional MerR regulator